MKKLYFMIITLLAFGLLLVGCSEPTEEAGAPVEATEAPAEEAEAPDEEAEST